MPITYERIAAATLSTASSLITFSSIPTTYTDLKVVFDATSANGTYPTFRFNSDSTGSYSMTYIYSSGSSASYGILGNQSEIYPLQGLSSAVPTVVTLDIFNYRSGTNKSMWIDIVGDGYKPVGPGLWRNTSVINRIDITALYGSSPNTFAAGTVASLYGIAAA